MERRRLKAKDDERFLCSAEFLIFNDIYDAWTKNGFHLARISQASLLHHHRSELLDSVSSCIRRAVRPSAARNLI